MFEKALALTSLQNPRVKGLVRLQERKGRDDTGTFLVESVRDIGRALLCGWQVEQLFLCPDSFPAEEAALWRGEPHHTTPELKEAMEALKGRFAQGKGVHVCTTAVFEKICFREKPDGFLAVVKSRLATLEDLAQRATKAHEKPFFLLAEGVEKPGNLGALLRSADGAGVHGLILTTPRVDVFNPSTVRASAGTLFSVPVVVAPLDAICQRFQEWGVSLWATTPHTSHLHTSLPGAEALCLAVGTEHEGLGDELLAKAQGRIKIPMRGLADSLNVNVAAAVALYEVLRQRQL